MREIRKKIQKYAKEFWHKSKKDFKKGEYNFPILLGVVSILLVFVGVRLIHITNSDKKISERQENIIEQLDAFTDIQGLLAQQIEIITSSSQIGLDSLRQQTDDRIAEARDAIENARVNLEDQIALQSSAARNVISTWRPRIPQIKCYFTEGQGDVKKVSTSRGSGTFFDESGLIQIFSNQHVFEEDGKTLRDCDVVFPGTEDVFSFEPPSITLVDNAEVDFAKATVTNPPTYITERTATSLDICQERAAIGDNIIILGYPKIGSIDDITATEGIISGFDGNFYITSAKVAKGNSGGAAVLVQKNCYLGIPTFTTAGQVESLARILDINRI